MLFTWLQFAVCAALIWAGGIRLSRYGDIIAEKTGLGRTWIGLLLLASVTSLPELLSGISAVLLVKAPDIAVGNILGACVINLFMIVLLDFLNRGESVYTRASQGHILSAGFGIVLLGLVAFSIVVGGRGGAPAIFHVGISSLILLAVYVLAMRTVYRYEQRQIAEFRAEATELYADVSLGDARAGFIQASIVVVAAAVWLPFAGERMAQIMGWDQTFVGTLFLAFATTLPEMVVTVTALRIGALDMAIGNLFGSNLFNIAIIGVDDIFYFRGPIYAHVSQLHLVSALSAIMMTGVAIVGLLYRPRQRVLRTVGWASLMLLSLYLLNVLVLYLYAE